MRRGLSDMTLLKPETSLAVLPTSILTWLSTNLTQAQEVWESDSKVTLLSSKREPRMIDMMKLVFTDVMEFVEAWMKSLTTEPEFGAGFIEEC